MINNKKQRVLDYIFLQFIFLVYSLAGIVSKKASQYNFLSENFIKFYLIELIIIFVYAYLWQQIIKKFDITTAYSSKGIVIIWALLWSVLFFHESIKLTNIIGAFIIIIGIRVVLKDDN